MPGPLTRYLRDRDHSIRLYDEVVRNEWHLTPEQLDRVRENLLQIAANRRQPSRALKAIRILQMGMKHDNERQLKMLELIQTDEAIEERIANEQERRTVRMSPAMPLDQVHRMLRLMAPTGPPSVSAAAAGPASGDDSAPADPGTSSSAAVSVAPDPAP